MEADNAILLAIVCALSVTCFHTIIIKVIAHLSYTFVSLNVLDPLFWLQLRCYLEGQS
jgi:hypothetical protein